MYTLPVVHNLFVTSVLYVDDLFVRLSLGSLGSFGRPGHPIELSITKLDFI